MPEVTGLARAYELLSNTTDKAIVDTFFSVLTTNHSYATGGSNSGECWQEPRDLGAFLTDQTEESCTQYNVLKIARSSFMVSADAKYADFYERAIWNGIIGNQKRESSGGTSYTYMLPLGGANFKGWGKSDSGFPCCWGTLSESFAKLGDSIFFASRDNRRLHVNQFVSATVRWGGATIEQVAYFPQDPKRTSTISFRLQRNMTFGLMVRVPGWAVSTNAVLINGQPVAEKLTPGSFVSLDRTWSSGDLVELFFPLSLLASPLNDHHPEYNATLAFMYGPLVLAGVHMTSDLFIPRSSDPVTDPSSFITRNSSTELTFEAVARNGTKMLMIPLRDVMDEQYVVYFMTAGSKPPQPPVVYCPRSAGKAVTSAPMQTPDAIVSRGARWRRANGRFSATRLV